MSRSFLSFVGVRWILLLAILLGLMTGWTATAFAQTSAEGQYASPTSTPSGNPAEFVNFTSPEGFTSIESGNGAEGVSFGEGGVAEEPSFGGQNGVEEVPSGGEGGVAEEPSFGGAGVAEEPSFGAVGGASGGGGSEASGGGGGAPESGGRGGVIMGVLPETGGPLILFVALGVLALGSTGLLAFRRTVLR